MRDSRNDLIMSYRSMQTGQGQGHAVYETKLMMEERRVRRNQTNRDMHRHTCGTAES